MPPISWLSLVTRSAAQPQRTAQTALVELDPKQKPIFNWVIDNVDKQHSGTKDLIPGFQQKVRVDYGGILVSDTELGEVKVSIFRNRPLPTTSSTRIHAANIASCGIVPLLRYAGVMSPITYSDHFEPLAFNYKRSNSIPELDTGRRLSGRRRRNAPDISSLMKDHNWVAVMPGMRCGFYIEVPQSAVQTDWRPFEKRLDFSRKAVGWQRERIAVTIKVNNEEPLCRSKDKETKGPKYNEVYLTIKPPDELKSDEPLPLSPSPGTFGRFISHRATLLPREKLALDKEAKVDEVLEPLLLNVPSLSGINTGNWQDGAFEINIYRTVQVADVDIVNDVVQDSTFRSSSPMLAMRGGDFLSARASFGKPKPSTATMGSIFDSSLIGSMKFIAVASKEDLEIANLSLPQS
ncbi:MAG: hypothetical protein A3B68_09945 [Candidatus Melainabacteria bacterium RIFCSPHIGHO2_02_FULL_34_12]|nr:MAG: hypothetical protein A3B68_09945 [Candidatus Melainabacteria bacterium RIFCSPHIGHO2_02_FULL_34_12]